MNTDSSSGPAHHQLSTRVLRRGRLWVEPGDLDPAAFHPFGSHHRALRQRIFRASTAGSSSTGRSSLDALLGLGAATVREVASVSSSTTAPMTILAASVSWRFIRPAGPGLGLASRAPRPRHLAPPRLERPGHAPGHRARRTEILYTVDGDLYRARGNLAVELGPALSFVRLRSG